MLFIKDILLILLTGSTKLLPIKQGQKKQSASCLSSTKAVDAINYSDFNLKSEWYESKTFVTESEKDASRKTWVFAKSLIAVCAPSIDYQ